jgi:nuclear-control-of-ATPase protein 2
LVERKKLTDATALRDAESSLKNMLDAFIQDTQPDMPVEQRRDIVERMDMSVLSSQYEQSLRHTIKNFVTGDIVRMLLIQVQYIKADLLSTMSAVENLIDANEFNFRLTATLPALFALWAVTSLST